MSRIGNRKINIPEEVTINLDNNELIVKGPKGELTLNIPLNVVVEFNDNEVIVKRINDKLTLKQIHGTINSLITNMIKGVTKGFEKSLEIVGVGYRFQIKEKQLIINAGYSHPVILNIPDDLIVSVVSNTEIVVKGIDKQKVGEFAANIRKVREPEPYKGKGIHYKDEIVRRKEGKKAS
jgi:large subunit ribosomal protein L6